jgi:starch-binding outer membrane protein, SusD/RagB family
VTNFNYIISLLFITLLFDVACKKASDLDEITDSSLLVMRTTEDAQAALDNIPVMKETPGLSEISADNMYLAPDSVIPLMNPVIRNAHLWNADIFQGQELAEDWFMPYRQVYYANSVLASLPKISGDAMILRQIKGAALFIRAYAFHNIALEFSNLYDASTLSDPGIPLRLTPDPEPRSKRATIRETYDQIIKDLKEAVTLLPRQVDAEKKNRPAVPAAFALLARVYLSMSDYQNARVFADSCLNLYNRLIDYNLISTSTVNPFTANNEEVLYQTNLLSSTGIIYIENCLVDSILYSSYDGQDLRKTLFFTKGSTGLPVPHFSYSGDYTRFSGLAVDEVLLVRAECNARLSQEAKALQDVATLLKMRWKNNAYNTPPVSSANDILELVLLERRKELVFRGLRWADIRRLNKLGASIILKRKVNGKESSLLPGDKRYVLPIPPDVIGFNSDMPQNER